MLQHASKSKCNDVLHRWLNQDENADGPPDNGGAQDSMNSPG
jgi:hypothetical protein